MFFIYHPIVWDSIDCKREPHKCTIHSHFSGLSRENSDWNDFDQLWSQLQSIEAAIRLDAMDSLRRLAGVRCDQQIMPLGIIRRGVLFLCLIIPVLFVIGCDHINYKIDSILFSASEKCWADPLKMNVIRDKSEFLIFLEKHKLKAMRKNCDWTVI